LFGFKFVKFFYFIHDVFCAHIIFIPLFVLGALQLPGHIQTWLLYHNALSANVVVSDILRYARKNKESSGGGEADEDLVEQVAELRKVVQRQEQLLTGAGLSAGNALASRGESYSPTETPEPQPRAPRAQSGGRYGRAISMTGMDVWGDMALGDVGDFSRDAGSGGTMMTESTAGSSATQSTSQGFSFSQPDTMPPR
jgi:callose synthase